MVVWVFGLNLNAFTLLLPDRVGTDKVIIGRFARVVNDYGVLMVLQKRVSSVYFV